MYRERHRVFARTGITALGLAVVMFGLLALPAIASAKATPLTSVQIGPFKEHGYVFTFSVYDCDGAKSTGEIDYEKGTDKNYLDYSYSGTANCVTNGSLKKLDLTVSWGKLAKINFTIDRAGRKTALKTPKGCTGGKGSTRADLLKGSFAVDVSKRLAQVHAKHAVAAVSVISGTNCKTPATPKATELSAEFGTDQFISAVDPTKGLHDVFLEDGFNTSVPGVTGGLDIQVSGKKDPFETTKTGAVITALKPFATGKLVAMRQAACLGSGVPAVNVLLSGSITVKSAVLGTVTFSPSAATSASLGTGDALPLDCDGYGSSPDQVGVDNTCDMDQVCSVMYTTNSDTFYDTSNLGTQTVVSATINFGDGSATEPFTDGVTHTYATPGMYTATVTVETDNGQTQTASTTVYVDS